MCIRDRFACCKGVQAKTCGVISVQVQDVSSVNILELVEALIKTGTPVGIRVVFKRKPLLGTSCDFCHPLYILNLTSFVSGHTKFNNSAI